VTFEERNTQFPRTCRRLQRLKAVHERKLERLEMKAMQIRNKCNVKEIVEVINDEWKLKCAMENKQRTIESIERDKKTLRELMSSPNPEKFITITPYEVITVEQKIAELKESISSSKRHLGELEGEIMETQKQLEQKKSSSKLRKYFTKEPTVRRKENLFKQQYWVSSVDTPTQETAKEGVQITTDKTPEQTQGKTVID